MTKSEILINIERLKTTLTVSAWNKGYVANVKRTIAWYESLLNEAV